MQEEVSNAPHAREQCSEELGTSLVLPASYCPPAVPNLSLLQASEQLFSCLTATLAKCFLRHCIETSEAEGCSGTEVDFAFQNDAARGSAWCQGAGFSCLGC